VHRHGAEREPRRGGAVLAGAREVDAVQPDGAQGVGVAGAGHRRPGLEDLGAGQLAGAEVGEAGHGLAPLAAGAQRLGEGAQPLLVFEVDALDDLDELAQVDLGVGVATGAQRPLGADPQDVGVDHRGLRAWDGAQRAPPGRGRPRPGGASRTLALDVADDLAGALGAAAVAERVVVDDVDAVEVVEVAEVERAAGEDEDAVDRRARGEGDDLGLGQLALAVGEQVDEDLAVAAARGGELGVELADDAGVVAAALGPELQDVGDLGVALGADAHALVEAAVEEAEDDVLAEQGEPLAQREREAAGEHLTHAAHRGGAVDEHVVRALLVLHLLLVGEVEQLVVDVLLLEDVLVEGELGQLEVVDAAAALDRGVAVDREHLLAGVALDLEDRGEQLHREVDDVGEGRADHDVVEVGEVDARGGLARAAAEQAEQAQGVDVDLLDGEQREQAVGRERSQPRDRLALVVAGERGARLDARVVGGVDGQLDRPQHADVVGELGDEAGEDAREHDADHRVAVLPAGLGADQVALGDLDQELAPGLAQLGLGDAAGTAPGAPRPTIRQPRSCRTTSGTA
jgi:hypothetical protein